MNKQAIGNFNSFSFHPLIDSGIKQAGYQTPTPIQAKTIPLILEGCDIMGLAQTGTGKTAAFVLPILQKLIAHKNHSTRALIVVPTRELAEQVYTVIKQLAQQTKIQCMTIYGGVAMLPQIRKLKRGTDIIVACPGRLLDHIQRKTIDLSNIEVLVLDEADQMFDMGFLPDLKNIINALPAQRQTLMFSATMPEEIRALANEILHSPTTIQIANTQPANTVSHYVYLTTREHKTSLLMSLLRQAEHKKVLVFSRTKHQASRLAEQLCREGIRAAALQGNMSQAKRQQAMSGFRRKYFQVLVATDIAARGIDVSDIGYVINYDIPDTAQAYTHRIGRTGRAEKTGQAFTFITQSDLYLLRNIEHAIGKKIEQRSLEGLTLTVPINTHHKNKTNTKHRKKAHQHSARRANNVKSNARNSTRHKHVHGRTYAV
jgi:ATP-dependent RNA helicase RhlE